jgi:3-hydroxyacyl-CoA dehydrogenase
MIERLRSAVVLGAGTMGAQLACLLAGAGARVRLLDIDRGLAEEGLARARKARPTPLYRPIDANRIVAGGFEELVDAVADGEWVLEAIVEDLEAKRNLLGRVDEALGERPTPPTITTNTSALSVRAMAEGRSDAFRRVFLGTHFFNPPRYTRLLELVPTDETEPDRIAWFEGFASRHLGKGTVRANDTPAFIANRLGTHGMLCPLPGAGARPRPGRGGRPHGAAPRAAEERDVPDPRPRRARRRARRRRPLSRRTPRRPGA